MEIDNFIYQEFIDTNLCDKLIEFYEDSPNKFRGTFGEKAEENFKYKQSTEIAFGPNDGEIFSLYVKELNKVCDSYKKKYVFSDIQQNKWTWIGSKIQKYNFNEGYHVWHCENEGSPNSINRHLVFMTYLNDIKNEGETGFFYQNLKIKPKKGLTLIWPAVWTHTHKGFPTSFQQKYIVTGWYGWVND
jgi:prolyl 4-hydroxylase